MLYCASSFKGKGTFVLRGLEVSKQGNTPKFRTETDSGHPKVTETAQNLILQYKDGHELIFVHVCAGVQW